MIDVVTTNRVLKAVADTFSAQFYNNGVIADPGATTIALTNAAGTVLQAATAMSGTLTSPRTYALTGTHTANLDTLTVTLVTTNYGTSVVYLEVVGAHLFSILEARTWRGGAMADDSKYPQSAIERARARITDEFEEEAGVSFIPRYEYVILNGEDAAGYPSIDLLKRDGRLALHANSVRSVDVRYPGESTWTAFTAAELTDTKVDSFGRISRESLGYFPNGRQNIRVGYEHGFTRVPLAVSDAALMILYVLLVDTNLTDRAISRSGEFGTEMLATAGKFGSVYGVPHADRVIETYRSRVPAFG